MYILLTGITVLAWTLLAVSLIKLIKTLWQKEDDINR